MFSFLVEKEELNNKNISGEGVTSYKFIHFLKVMFVGNITKSLLTAKSFCDIDFEDLLKSGKKGFILDMDDCIAHHHGNILNENFEKIEWLLSIGAKIIIFSNMKKTDRYKEIENLGIHVLTPIYPKPDPRGFLECLNILGLTPQETVMIGDNYLTDGGSMRIGVDFIKLRPLCGKNEKFTFRRVGHKMLRGMADFSAKTIHGNV